MQYCDLWLIERGAERQMQALTHSLRITSDALEAAQRSMEAVRETGAAHRREKAVAILPVHGVLETRGSLLGSILGMTSMEAVGHAFSRLVADDSVSHIVLDIASPGGMFYGTPELAAKVHSARGIKPIVAVANPMAASGGYWLASAADRVIATPSADVGSVGVIVSRFDATAAMEREGVKEHVFRSSVSPYKGEMNEAEPMTDESSHNIQRRVDAAAERFVTDLAAYRGVTTEHVEKHFGRGRLVDSRAALSAGMIDRVMTLEETVYKLAAGRIRIGGAAAQDDWDAKTPVEARRSHLRAKSEAIRAEVN